MTIIATIEFVNISISIILDKNDTTKVLSRLNPSKLPVKINFTNGSSTKNDKIANSVIAKLHKTIATNLNLYFFILENKEFTVAIFCKRFDEQRCKYY